MAETIVYSTATGASGLFPQFFAWRVRCVFSSQPQFLTLDVPQAGPTGWRAVARTLRSPIDHLACALFPATCNLCEVPLLRLGAVPVCEGCWADLPAQTGALCLGCGEALGAHAFADADRAPGDWMCRPCQVSPPHFSRAVAHGLYRGTMRALLHKFKYEGMEPIAGRLGALMAAQVCGEPGLPVKLTVVPVPLFAAKQRQRGYNQAELLARCVVAAGRRQGMDWKLDTNLLRRKRATDTQAGLTPRQRRANLRGAFYVPGSRRDPLATECKGGKRGALLRGDVLLIDDIYTTGATARSASLTLREAGARSVWVATAARAQRMEAVPPPAPAAMEDDVAFWG